MNIPFTIFQTSGTITDFGLNMDSLSCRIILFNFFFHYFAISSLKELAGLNAGML